VAGRNEERVCKPRLKKGKGCGLSWKGSKISAIFLAAEVTIGVVVSSITNSLKATGKDLGKA